MLTYSDPKEEIIIGISSEEPDGIIKILEDLLGYEFIKNNSDEFDEIGSLYNDTVVVRLGLVDEEFLMTMIDNEINVLIVS